MVCGYFLFCFVRFWRDLMKFQKITETLFREKNEIKRFRETSQTPKKDRGRRDWWTTSCNILILFSFFSFFSTPPLSRRVCVYRFFRQFSVRCMLDMLMFKCACTCSVFENPLVHCNSPPNRIRRRRRIQKNYKRDQTHSK